MTTCCNFDCRQGRECSQNCPTTAFYRQHKAFFDVLGTPPEPVDEASVPFPRLPQIESPHSNGALLGIFTVGAAVGGTLVQIWHTLP